jgi:hydrogenase/urease accessory protein HupE
VFSLFLSLRKGLISQRMAVMGICITSIICILINLFPTGVSAHAYSSSFTEINFTDEQTEVNFSIDTLSIIELIEGIDKNENGILEESELIEDEHHVEELLHTSIVIDKDNEQQEAKWNGMKIENKDNKEYVTFSFEYPAFFPGDTISLSDGFYFKDSKTNYINLISAQNRGETSQAILQGDNRTWTILLTELQQEQGSTETTEENPNSNKEQTQNNETTMESSDNSWFSFFKLGMLHILTGYDHLLFLLALLFRKQTFKQYAAIVTSFTIAHSITITLAVLGIIDLPSKFVEATIAFSIVYVALENLFRKEIRHRWGLTFAFGLIHGLGFANLLQEMNISKSQLAGSMLSFNIGIELVQLILVLLVLPLLTYIHRLSFSQKILQYLSILIILLGGFWFIERVFS